MKNKIIWLSWAVLLPIALYGLVGNPYYIFYHQVPSTQEEIKQNITVLSSMVAKNEEEWFVLALQQQAIGDYSQALLSWQAGFAFGKEKDETFSAPLFAQIGYLESKIFNDTFFTDQSKKSLDALLEIDANNPRLWLLASRRYQEEGDYLGARTFALKLVPVTSGTERESLLGYIQALDDKIPTPQKLNTLLQTIKQLEFTLSVTVNQALSNAFNSNASVFVSVVPAGSTNPTMPLAARRLKIADLTTPIKIGPRDAIAGQLLQKGTPVVIKILVSHQGGVTKMKGDLYGEQNAIIGKSDKNINISIYPVIK
ncbi:MAG: hypothetical protein QM538_04370 [Methylacidiphilales bacterium]|nr:hypothetical protein [Candidatus Methylacidiphilales bacterium]